MDGNERLTFGLSRDLFVATKSKGETIVVGGTGGDTSRWVRVLSKRAAQLLLFQLTQILDPDRANMMNTSVTTAPMRDVQRPTITTHMIVRSRDEGGFSITGWAGDKVWDTHLTRMETQRLWIALTNALYPDGLPQ